MPGGARARSSPQPVAHQGAQDHAPRSAETLSVSSPPHVEAPTPLTLLGAGPPPGEHPESGGSSSEHGAHWDREDPPEDREASVSVRPSVDIRVQRLSFNPLRHSFSADRAGQPPAGPGGAAAPAVDAVVVEDTQEPEYARQAYEVANHPHSFTTKAMKVGMIAIYMFEKWVIVLLAVILAVFIVATLIECGYGLAMAFAEPPHLVMGTTQYLALLSSFFYTLIGIELLQSVAIHIETSDAHVEVILLVAITAVSRKIIILDSEHAGLEKMAGIALLCVALGATYFLVKYGHAIGRQIILAETGQVSSQDGEDEDGEPGSARGSARGSAQGSARGAQKAPRGARKGGLFGSGAAKASPRRRGLRIVPGVSAAMRRPSVTGAVIVASSESPTRLSLSGRPGGRPSESYDQPDGRASWDRSPRLPRHPSSPPDGAEPEPALPAREEYDPPVRYEVVQLYRGGKA